jgi:2-hydroxychromene-2-carboxylate isomerase
MTEPLEFWFDFASPYSYLAASRIEDLYPAVRWRPFLLGPIFKSFGWETSPFLLQKEKGAHMWIDMERQCRKYGISWTKPSVFPRAAVLTSRVALLLEEQGRAGPFCREIFCRNFVQDSDIADPAIVAEILVSIGESAELVIAAGTEAVKVKLRRQTELAQQRGVFGAPTFFAGPELFWGNDRLEDAIAEAAGKNVTNISLN